MIVVSSENVALPSRILVVGSGSIARRHIRNLRSLGVEEIVVWTQRRPEQVGLQELAVDIVSQLPNDCPKYAIVANDTDKHVAVAGALIERGAHVLVEKPLAAGLSREAIQLRELAETSGLIARVAYNLRFLGVFHEIEAVLAAGALGALTMVDIEAGQWLPDWRPGTDYRQSYSAHRERGGGVDLDLSHEVDYMCMLFGSPERSWVHKRNTGVLGIDAPDVFDAIYDFADGLRCTVHLDYLSKPVRRRMRVHGTEGSIECDLANKRLVVRRGNLEQVVDSPDLFDVEATYRAELLDFFLEAAGETASMKLPDLEAGCEVLALLNPPSGRLE